MVLLNIFVLFLFLFLASGTHSFLRTLERASLGLGPLTAARKTLPMTKSAVATEIHQALYIHRNVAAEVTLNLDILINMLPDLSHFRLSQVVATGIEINASCFENLLGQRSAYAVDVRKRDLYSLILR